MNRLFIFMLMLIALTLKSCAPLPKQENAADALPKQTEIAEPSNPTLKSANKNKSTAKPASTVEPTVEPTASPTAEPTTIPDPATEPPIAHSEDENTLPELPIA